jgi:hypothetical protein
MQGGKDEQIADTRLFGKQQRRSFSSLAAYPVNELLLVSSKAWNRFGRLCEALQHPSRVFEERARN